MPPLPFDPSGVFIAGVASMKALPFFAIAKRSCDHGCGMGCQNRSQCSGSARITKAAERMRCGLNSTFSMRPSTTEMKHDWRPTRTQKSSVTKRPRRTRLASPLTSSASCCRRRACVESGVPSRLVVS